MMQTDNKAALFRDWATYEQSLPVRRTLLGTYEQLHEHHRWVSRDDLQAQVRQLEDATARDEGGEGGERRMYVKYLAAPSGTGKTSAILPIFLESAEAEDGGGFTHYLYIAFSNNNGRSFVLDPPDPSTNVNTSAEQGAAFVFECLKILLDQPDKPGPHKIPRNDSPPPIEGESGTQKALAEYIKETLGEGCRVLIHLDEHRKMCSDKASNSPEFRRGAFEALASMQPNATLIATYTELPSVLGASQSSGACRFPVSMAPVDIVALIEDVPELRFPFSGGTADQRHLHSSLLFRLAMFITAKQWLSSLHRHIANAATAPEVRDFLTKFELKAKGASSQDPATVTAALKACIVLCSYKMPVHLVTNEDATNLLLGVPENGFEWDRQVSSLLVVKGKVTASLKRLLELDDPNLDVYDEGATRLRVLCEKPSHEEPSNEDLISDTRSRLRMRGS